MKKGLSCCQPDTIYSVLFWIVMLLGSIIVAIDLIVWRP